MIQNLIIQNYKSIGQLNLNCSRINVFIGEPNSGKSNILEALNLSDLSSMMSENQKSELVDIREFFRVSKVADIFHLGNITNPISVMHPGYSYSTFIERDNDEKARPGLFKFHNGNGSQTIFDNDFIPQIPLQFYTSPIGSYKFVNNIKFHDQFNYINKLMPPFGNNLANVIYHNSDMQQLVTDFARGQGFDFNINTETKSISIQLRVKEGIVYTLPYNSLADTYRRILFYTAAIRHSQYTVMTLDEPDAHAFPPYVSFLADEIIKQSSVQFFIATHNPYLLNTCIEKTPSADLSVFITSYDKKERETVVKKLSEKELSELLDFGADIFFNLNHYSDGNLEYSA